MKNFRGVLTAAGLAALLVLSGCGDGAADSDTTAVDQASIQTMPDAQVIMEGRIEGSLVKVVESRFGVHYAEVVPDGARSPLDADGGRSLSQLYRILTAEGRRDAGVVTRLEAVDRRARATAAGRGEGVKQIAIDAPELEYQNNSLYGGTSFFRGAFCNRLDNDPPSRRRACATDSDRREVLGINTYLIDEPPYNKRLLGFAAPKTGSSDNLRFRFMVDEHQCDVLFDVGDSFEETLARIWDGVYGTRVQNCDLTVITPIDVLVPAGTIARVIAYDVPAFGGVFEYQYEYYFRTSPPTTGRSHLAVWSEDD